MSNFELIYQYLKDLSKESVELFDDLMDRAEQGGVFSEKDISDLCNLLFLVEKDLENESSYNIQWTLKDRIMEMIIILVIEKESPICFEAIAEAINKYETISRPYLSSVIETFLTVFLLGSPNQSEEEITQNRMFLLKAMERCTRNYKKIVIGTAATLLVLSLIILFSLGRSFLPPFNEGSLTINISTMPGISLEESDRMGGLAEKILLGIPEIQTVARKTGRAELDEHALGVNTSEIEAPFELQDRDRDEFLADVRKQLGELKGANIEIGQPISHRIDAMLSGTKANIAIKLFGNDLNKLYSLGSEIKNSIQGIDGIADLTLEQQIERPQLQILPKRDMLARYGITLPEFSEFINVALAGKVVSQVNEGGKIFDLTIKVADHDRDSMEEIGELMLDADGRKVPLHYVAEVLPLSGPNTISRENVQRKIVVSANVAGRDLKGVVNDIQKTVDEQISLPEGYHIEYGGQFESEAAASRTLFLTSLISILLIFLILYHEFRSLPLSGIIMLNLPLAIIGGVISIWFTSGVISIPSIIGFISLFGIATRNGILLVSHYNHLREEGLNLRESIIQGSLDRLNPILMTALTSALALIPLAVGGDLPGNEIQSPMAQVILGGLLSSTLLNGFVVPIVYFLLNRKKEASIVTPQEIQADL